MKIKLVYIIIGLIIISLILYLMFRKPKKIIKSKAEITEAVITTPVKTPVPGAELSPTGDV